MRQAAVMTRIMTITSGLAQVGKTHLAINLALELVRRGHLAGVFHEPGQTAAVDALLELQRPAALLRRAGDHDAYGIMRRGYLGVDIVIDRKLGPLMLELNARPGLNIQLACGHGLLGNLHKIEAHPHLPTELDARLEFAKGLQQFGDIRN